MYWFTSCFEMKKIWFWFLHVYLWKNLDNYYWAQLHPLPTSKKWGTWISHKMRNVDTVKTNHKHINIPYTVKLKHVNLFLFQRNLHHCIEIIKKKKTEKIWWRSVHKIHTILLKALSFTPELGIKIKVDFNFYIKNAFLRVKFLLLSPLY